MTITQLAGVRSVLVAGLPPAAVESLRAGVAADWSVHGSVAGLRNVMVDSGGGLLRAPEVLVVGYARRHAWSVRVLLSLVLGLPGAVDTRVLLVAEGPRSALPVWLTDEPRLDVVTPDDIEARLVAQLSEGR